MQRFVTGLIAALIVAPTAALANDDGFEFWLNPSASYSFDDDTGVELETAQRFRNAEEGRADTYFARLWLHQEASDAVTLSAAIERRLNDGGSNETRVMQQMSAKNGIFRTRLRLEERFVDGAERMGLRLRPRLGVAIPVDADGRWTFKTDAELFFTLRSNSAGGDDGLTGLRTQVGIGHDVSERLSLSLVYLRNQSFEDGAPDEVGHAPLLGVEYAF